MSDDRRELIEQLRERIKTIEDLIDLREHDVDALWDAHETFLRKLLDLIDCGRIAEVRARIRWVISRVPS